MKEQKIVDEIIDLWHELRAIRELLEDYYTIPEMDRKDDNDTPWKRYKAKCTEFQTSWDNEKHLPKLFKKNIDPSILAFLDLEEEDKKHLTN